MHIEEAVITATEVQVRKQPAAAAAAAGDTQKCSMLAAARARLSALLCLLPYMPVLLCCDTLLCATCSNLT